MRLRNYAIVVLLMLATPLAAQETLKDSINQFIKNSLEKFKEIPGLAITVVKDNKPFYTKAYGFSNVENQTKSTNETAYYIASVTKSFVGLLAEQLAEEGGLDLDTSITEFAPIKNFKDKTVFKEVSIRDLLTHTSGIRNNTLTVQFAGIGEYTRASLISILENKTTSRHNKKSFRYDNLGYNILDIILSEEFNLNWKDLLKESVFCPLQMSHASAYLSKGRNKGWNIAKPYTSINDMQLPTLATRQKNDATLQAAGGMICSIEDARNWLLVNMNNGKLNGKQVFLEKVISKTHSAIANVKGRGGNIFKDTAYGMGWNNALYGKRKAIYHFGGFDGFFSHVSFLPEENIGIAVFCNESQFGDNVSNLIAGFVYDLLLGEVKSISDYNDKVEAVDKRINAIQDGFFKDRKRRSNRKWLLNHDFKKYLGDYKNKSTGTIKIRFEKGELVARLGISKAIATPSASEDAIRVEFSDSRGNDILFVSDDARVMAAVYNGTVFIKAND